MDTINNKTVLMSGKEKTSNKDKVKLWLKRVGVVGFLFFLIKGLIWVGIGVMAYYSAKD